MKVSLNSYTNLEEFTPDEYIYKKTKKGHLFVALWFDNVDIPATHTIYKSNKQGYNLYSCLEESKLWKSQH
jgi:hypothetical protein